MLWGTVAVALLGTAVKRTNLLIYGLIEVVASVLVVMVAWDRVAAERSFATSAVALAALYFMIRGMDNVATGWGQYFTRLDDISRLVFADVENDLVKPGD